MGDQLVEAVVALRVEVGEHPLQTLDPVRRRASVGGGRRGPVPAGVRGLRLRGRDLREQQGRPLAAGHGERDEQRDDHDRRAPSREPSQRPAYPRRGRGLHDDRGRVLADRSAAAEAETERAGRFSATRTHFADFPRRRLGPAHNYSPGVVSRYPLCLAVNRREAGSGEQCLKRHRDPSGAVVTVER